MNLQPEDTTGSDAALDEMLVERVEAFGASLSKKRDEAIAARSGSGIENEWIAAEDAYQGEDDANRGSARMAKPISHEGGVVNSRVRHTHNRSTVLPNITRGYVDTAAARVADVLLPTDDAPWAIKPTPVPEGQAPVAPAQPPVQPPVQMAPQAGPMAMGAPGQSPGQPPGQPQPPMQPPMPVDPLQAAMDIASRTQAQAARSAELATTQIEDWMVQCKWHAEVRKMLQDCARLGTGVLKGPTPKLLRSRSIRSVNGRMQLELKESIVPESKCISPWDFFPDGACGENIQDGSGTWERDRMSARELRSLKSSKGYIASQIDKALQEGPGAKYAETRFNSGNVMSSDRDVFEVWYYYGVAEREDLEAAGVDFAAAGIDPDKVDVTAHCLVTMVNSRVIKAAINPLDSGEFPYDVMAWQAKQGVPWGTGIAAQMSVPQRMLTAAVRNLNDNAALSSGPQIALRKAGITPADGRWEITPRKIWHIKEDSDVLDVRQCFQVFNIPTMQQELERIAQFAMKMAEDVTGMPALMQGQNTNAPDTVGVATMVNNNASTVLRRIARLFDDRVTESHVGRYYEWLMLDEEVGDECKGDFQIDARGSTALVERDLQNQYIIQMGQLVMNPAFGIDPEKWFSELLRSQRLDPVRFQMTDEQKQKASQNQPPPPPQIAVAQINAEARAAQAEADRQLKAQMHAESMQAGVQKVQVDTDRDLQFSQAQIQRDQSNHQARMMEMQLKERLAMLDYANRRDVTLEQVKASLAKEAMKINSVRELAGMKAPADLLPKPPVEPPQQAEPGKSYQQ